MELKELAKEYEGPKTKNIADIAKVPVDAKIEEREFEKTNDKGEKEKFRIRVAIIDGEEYRVPASVLKQLQIHLQANPGLKYIKVIKLGQGMTGTTYTVVPLG